MSFQGYLKTIKEKTGKSAADFRKLAEKKDLQKKEISTRELKLAISYNGLKKIMTLGMAMQWRSMLCFQERKMKTVIDPE